MRPMPIQPSFMRILRCSAIIALATQLRTGLRAIIALDDDEVRSRNGFAQSKSRLILGRAPALERSLVRWKLDYGIALAAGAFRILILPSPHEKPRAILLERSGIRCDVGLVLLHVF